MSFAQVIGSQLETHCKSVDVHQFLHRLPNMVFFLGLEYALFRIIDDLPPEKIVISHSKIFILGIKKKARLH